MTTLADLTRQTARLIQRMAMGTSTANEGVATQLTDTVNLVGYPDDEFNGGTIWITSGANAGRTRPITDFQDVNDRLIFAAFPSNIVSGVTWEAADDSLVTYADLRQAENLALREIGKVVEQDASLASVEGQLVYTLPAGVSQVTGIEIVENLGAADEKRPVNTHWEERDGQLIFDDGREPEAGMNIRVLYKEFHPELYADTDVLSTRIDEKYLVYLAARQAMRLAYKRFGKAGSETIPQWLDEAAEEAKKHVCLNEGTPSVIVRTA